MARAGRPRAPPVLQAMTPIGELPDLVLGPLRGRADSEWERGPAGKWTPAQIVEHLALGLTLSAETFLARKNHAPMTRRARTPAEKIARLFIFGFRWFPPGRKGAEGYAASADSNRRRAEGPFSGWCRGVGSSGSHAVAGATQQS